MLNNLLKKIIKKDPLKLKLIIFHLSGLIPRKRNLWVFGAHGGMLFTCNPKYLFLETQAASADFIDSVWITRNKNLARSLNARGLAAAYLFSIKGIWYCLRASRYFINVNLRDITFHTSKGAETVNLWHGIPLKKIEMDDERRIGKQKRRNLGKDNNRLRRFLSPKKYFKYTYVLSSSEYVTEYAMTSAFGLLPGRCLSYGFPRTDQLFEDTDSLLNKIELHGNSDTLSAIQWTQQFKKTLIYMPTFRDTSNDFIRLSGIDFKELDQKLRAAGYGLILKLHTATRINIEVSNLTNITLLNNGLDIYPILPFVDKMITDYSSIYFDYLLLDREIIFFPFDLATYMKDCRSLYLNYEATTPGVKAFDFNQLCEAIFEERDLWKEERKSLRNQFWGEYSGDASSKLIERFADWR